MVLAFYYVWYAPNSEKWVQSKDMPVLGRYSSSDENVILKHCEWAKKYGIDGFVISYWKERNPADLRKMKSITEVLEKCGLKYTFYIENGRPTDRIDTVLKHFGDRRNLIRINGKPLIFLYNRVIQKLSIGERRRLMELSDRVYLSLDGFNGLNGFTAGNMHTYINLKDGVDWAKEVCDYTHAFGGLCAIPVSPGFDFKRDPRLYVDREGGRTYVRQWERAIKSGADIVLITSFNEWIEGTHVEPSKRYGFRYLQLTRRMARKFKSRVRKRKVTFKPAKFDKHPNLCLMPRGKTAVTLLLQGRSIDRYSFNGCNVVVYDEGEIYDPEFVPLLVDHVRRGGTLVLAGGPFPMFYTWEMEKKPATERFGLRIGFGPDLKGEYGGTVTVEGEGRAFRYYAVGDTRLRVLENPHSAYYTLRRLSTPLGTVVGERRLGSGRILFLWRGLAEQPYLPSILNDVLR